MQLSRRRASRHGSYLTTLTNTRGPAPTARRVGWLAGFATVASGVMLATMVTPAYAALSTGPTVTQVTGIRPNATRLSFRISDQVTASVDVGTGNLNVTANELSLPGINGNAVIGTSYNSLDTSAGAGVTSAMDAKGWSYNLDGAGQLEQQSSGTLVWVGPDGSAWPFTPSGSAYVSPAGLKAVLAGNSTSGWTLTFLQTYRVISFDTNGMPTQVADRNNNLTTISFPYGNTAMVTSTAGPLNARTANFSYSSSTGTLTVTQTNGSSRNAQFTKNSSSQLISIQDANSKTTAFTYTSGLLTKIVNAAGEETDITYDSSNRATQVDQHNTSAGSPGTSTTRFQYTSTTHTYVAGPNTPPGSFPSSGYADYTIDSNHMVTTAKDAAGRTRSAAYNANLDATSVSSGTTSASGTSIGYTPTVNNGQSVTSVTEGLSTSNPTSTFTYGNASPQTQYLPSGGSNDAGNAMTIGYNGPGNPTTTTNSSTTVTAKLNYPTTGNVGLPSSAAAPGNGSNVTSYSYTNYQLTGITPVSGTSLTSRALTYDAFGRLHTETDGRGNTTTYTYDNDDRLLTTAFSDGTMTVTNVYDSVGDLTSQASAPGTITNVYDQLGRLTSTVNTAGGDTEKYGYDLASNQVTTTDSRGTTTNVFDASGVLTQTQYAKSGGTQYTNFGTDPNGRRTDVWLQSTSNTTGSTANNAWAAHINYSYDSSNRVTGITADRGPASSPVAQMNVTYSFDPSTTGTTCQPTPPPAGDRSKLQSAVDHILGQTTVYCYDTSSRLTSMTQTGGTGTNNTYSYAYDVRGNRTSATVNGTPQTWTYNAANQITNTGYSYDGAGNLTATPTASYTYNGAEQMMTSAEGGVTYHYAYAGASQNAVLSEQYGGTNTIQITYGRADQNGNPVIEGYKVNNGQAYVENDPVTGAANMLRTSSGIACLYVWDGTGNPVALLTDFNSPSFTYTYDPYGLPTLTYNSGGNGVGQNPYLFKGGIQDRATGFVKFGGRWYDPTTGRWTQQDTLDAPLDPANANRYMFAGDDPINNGDPRGQDACTDSLLAGYGTDVAIAADVAAAGLTVETLWGALAFGAAGVGLEMQVPSQADAVVNNCTAEDPTATGAYLGINSQFGDGW